MARLVVLFVCVVFSVSNAFVLDSLSNSVNLENVGVQNVPFGLNSVGRILDSGIQMSNFFGADAGQKWDGLKVKWDMHLGGFNNLPRTEDEAYKDGYVLMSDCSDGTPFAGKRYNKNDDVALILLYDHNGFIAGIQTGIHKDEWDAQNTTSLTNHPMIMFQNIYFITAYFVKPAIICNTGRNASEFAEQGTGTGLYIQNGTSWSTVVEIPRTTSELHQTLWQEGACFISMGTHYWYDISHDMSCDEFFPVFLLINHNQLTGFGWVLPGNVHSNTYEHLSSELRERFFKDVPQCIIDEEVSSMHVYLRDHITETTC